MQYITQNFIPKFIFFLSILLTTWLIDNQLNIQKSEATYESLMELENDRAGLNILGISSLKDVVVFLVDVFKVIAKCITSMLTFPFSSINNVCIPYLIGKDVDMYGQCEKVPKNVDDLAEELGLVVGRISAFIAGLALDAILLAGTLSIFFPVLIVVHLFYTIPKWMFLAKTCVGMYNIAPHEHIMMGLGDSTSDLKPKNLECSKINGKYQITPKKQNGSDYLTSSEVPFFYRCDCQGAESKQAVAGHTICKGYVGQNSEFCSTKNTSKRARPNLVHSIGLGIVGNIFRDTCDIKDDQMFIIKPGYTTTIKIKPQKIFSEALPSISSISIDAIAFFRLSSGKIQLCTAISSLFYLPVRMTVGCTYITPPFEHIPVDGSIQDFVANTRCQYILPGHNRRDLSYVASKILNEDDGAYNSVYLFLKSDWHMMSTIFGCIQDMLEKIMINPGSGTTGNDSFLKEIQKGMEKIVLACLLLYVSLLGIKIISSPEPPKRGEWVMYIIKFALVIYFGLGDVWYKQDATGNKGLYPALMNASQEIIELFMSAQSKNDTLSMCYFEYPNGGENILSNRTVPVKDAQGDSYAVKLTVWDYLDCILINYLNGSSCNYSSTGLFFLWLIPTCIFCGLGGLVLIIVMAIYALMIFMVLLKFFHLALLTIFTLTLLVMIAPIVMCFYLFDFTKDVATQWFRLLIGYTMYPGLLFSFLALMLITLDHVFYDVDQSKIEKWKRCSATNSCSFSSQDYEELCPQGRKQSVFCLLSYYYIGEKTITGCGLSGGQSTSLFTESKNLSFITQDIICAKGDLSLFGTVPLIKVMLFAALFYFFMESVVNLISSLLMIDGMSTNAVLGKAIGSMAVSIAKMKSGAAKSAAKMSMASLKGSGKGGDDKNKDNDDKGKTSRDKGGGKS